MLEPLAGVPMLRYPVADTGGTTSITQVTDSYNGLGQLTSQQEYLGSAYGLWTVQYNYNAMASGENNSRLRSIVYPNGLVVDYTYSTRQEPVTGITFSGQGSESTRDN